MFGYRRMATITKVHTYRTFKTRLISNATCVPSTVPVGHLLPAGEGRSMARPQPFSLSVALRSRRAAIVGVEGVSTSLRYAQHERGYFSHVCTQLVQLTRLRVNPLQHFLQMLLLILSFPQLLRRSAHLARPLNIATHLLQRLHCRTRKRQHDARVLPRLVPVIRLRIGEFFCRGQLLRRLGSQRRRTRIPVLDEIPHARCCGNRRRGSRHPRCGRRRGNIVARSWQIGRLMHRSPGRCALHRDIR